MTRNAKRLFILLLLVTTATSAVAGELLRGENPIPGRYIVVLKDGEAFAQSSQAARPGLTVAEQATGLTNFHGGRVDRLYEHAVRGFVLHGDERAARAIARDARVAYVEQDQYVRPFAFQALPHWGLDRIDERDRPRNNHFTYNTTGSGVNIYVIDTGVNADSDLGTRRVNAFTTVIVNGVPQYTDCNGHGTQVAKLAAGTVAGVAKAAKIYNVRVGTICAADCGPNGDGGRPGGPKVLTTDACSYALSDVIAGMNWVAANRVRPAVANLSLGGPASATFDAAARGMHNAGVVVVAAAGNDGVDACGVSPARTAEAITVGAVDINDGRSFWANGQSSNTGSCIDLFAPGSDVNGFNGTSAAAPMVAGAAALYLQINTLAAPATVATTLVNNATTGRLTGLGAGSPNRLLFAAPGGSETDQPPVAGNFACSCNGGKTCTFTYLGGNTDDFAVSNCRYLVDYDNWNRPIFRYGGPNCGTVTYTYKYTGPYTVDFSAIDDAGQSGAATMRFCQ